jgi:hypothetical protein
MASGGHIGWQTSECGLTPWWRRKCKVWCAFLAAFGHRPGQEVQSQPDLARVYDANQQPQRLRIGHHQPLLRVCGLQVG